MKTKKIPNYPDYKVSMCGQIISNRRKIPIFMKPTSNGNGYLKVGIINKKGKKKNEYVHRLVLLAYVGPCPENMECSHKNGDRSDNRLENLEYLTHLENEKRKILHNTLPIGENNQNAKFKKSDIKLMRKLYSTGEYDYEEIGEMFYIHHRHARKIINREIWKHVE